MPFPTGIRLPKTKAQKKYESTLSIDQARIQGTEIHVLTRDGYAVPEQLYNSIREKVQNFVPTMQRDVGYTLEKLCGDDFWEELSDSDRRLAGRAMVGMIHDGMFPEIELYGCKHSSPKRYILK